MVQSICKSSDFWFHFICVKDEAKCWRFFCSFQVFLRLCNLFICYVFVDVKNPVVTSVPSRHVSVSVVAIQDFDTVFFTWNFFPVLAFWSINKSVQEFWVSVQEVQHFHCFFFVLRVVWDYKVSNLSGIVLLVKFSKWFDVDLTVCYTTKQAVTVVSWSYCFFTNQPCILRKIITSVARCYVFWNVSCFVVFVKSLQVFYITWDCIAVNDLRSVTFQVNNEWKSINCYIVEVIWRSTVALVHRKWNNVWIFFFDGFQDRFKRSIVFYVWDVDTIFFNKWSVEGKVLRRCNVGCHWNSIDLAIYSVPFDVCWVKCFVKVFPFFLVQFCQVSIGTFLSINNVVVGKGNIIVFTRWDDDVHFLCVVTPTKILDIQFSTNFLFNDLVGIFKKNIQVIWFVTDLVHLDDWFTIFSCCWFLVVTCKVSTSSKSSSKSNDTSRC